MFPLPRSCSLLFKKWALHITLTARRSDRMFLWHSASQISSLKEKTGLFMNMHIWEGVYVGHKCSFNTTSFKILTWSVLKSTMMHSIGNSGSTETEAKHTHTHTHSCSSRSKPTTTWNHYRIVECNISMAKINSSETLHLLNVWHLSSASPSSLTRPNLRAMK